MQFYTNVCRIGNEICVREIKNTAKKSKKIKYSPTLYVKTNKKSRYKDIQGNFLEAVKFKNIKKANKFYNEYKNSPNIAIYGNVNFANQWILDNYVDKVPFDQSKLKVLIIDIETEVEKGFPNVQLAEEKINLIGCKVLGSSKNHVFGFGDYTSKKEENVFHKFSDEKEMLEGFLDFFSKGYPDIVIGWNSEFFDIPYLITRMRNVLGEEKTNKLSPWKKIEERIITYDDQKVEKTYKILGVACLDYMTIYKKNTFEPRESFKLNEIAMVELGYGKVDYSGSFKDLYTKEYDKFVEYNIRDFCLIDDLDKKLQLIKLCLFIAYDSKVNFDDVLFQVRCWNSRTIDALKKDNIFVQINRKKTSKKEKFKGAYVKDPIPGKYKWICSFDVTSLYPNIMRALNMGFDTKIECTHDLKEQDVLLNNDSFKEHRKYAVENNYTLACNGTFYSKEKKSYYYNLLTDLFNKRIEFKKLRKEYQKKMSTVDKNSNEYFEYSQKASEYTVFDKSVKVCLNSNYGAIGNPGYIFFDVDNAEAVTITGRVIIQITAREMNKHLNKLFETSGVDYVKMIDTDSNFFDLSKLVEKEGLKDKAEITEFLNNFCEEVLIPIIDKITSKISSFVLNSDEDLIKMIRDVISDESILLKKKHYIMSVLDTEGERHKEPKLKIMGIRAIKSNVPKACRDSIKKMIPVILHENNDRLVEEIEKFKKKFNNLDISDIALNSGMSDYYKNVSEDDVPKKGCPYHVRAAANYNKFIKENKMESIYPLLRSKEKIKIVYLKNNNSIGNSIIAFPTPIPEILNLSNNISYSTQFEKTFLMPLSKIIEPIGWTAYKKQNIEDFI